MREVIAPVFEQSSAIRPARESMPAVIGVAAIWSAIVAAFFSSQGVLWPAFANGALMLALVLATWRTQVALKLYEEGGTIFYDSGFGRPREVACAGDGSRIARVSCGPELPGVVDYWLGPDGRTRLKTSELKWDLAELTVLWKRAGLAVPEQPEVVTHTQAQRRYPDGRPALLQRLLGPSAGPAHAQDLSVVRPVGLFGVNGGGAFHAREAMLDDGVTLSYRDYLGRVRPVARRGKGGRVVRVYVRGVRGRGVHRHLWLDAAGRCQLRLDEPRWDTDTLAALRERCGLPFADLPGAQTGAELDRQFPGAVAWEEAHPVSATAMLVVALFGGPIAILLVYDQLTR